MTERRKKRVPAFSREKWLEVALETLAETRKSKFNLEALIAAMPVTKGSFYNHFRDRRDFLLALVNFWDRHYTRSVIDALHSLPEETDPRQRLMELVFAVDEMKLNRFELLMRSMTLELPEIEEAVKAVDAERYDTLKSLFTGLGFEDRELDLRVRMFMTVISQEDNLLLGPPDGERSKQLQMRIDFLTRP
jgi:AcrR family transcriptional regulator